MYVGGLFNQIGGEDRRVGFAAFSSAPTLTVSKDGTGNGTVTSSPAGIDCGSTCSAEFDSGTPVTLTATPESGSNFAGWSGAGCSGTGTCQITVAGAEGVTATFADATPPDTTITSGPTGPTNDSSPSFGFSSSDAGSSFECRLDSAAWSACTSPKAYAGLADGPHEFQVRATDPDGNIETVPASRNFTVDTTPPQTTITSGPSNQTNDATPTFEFASSEQGSSFECEIDGGGFSACATPATLTALAEGNHTFNVRATDAVGNVDLSPASRTFEVDTTAPQSTIDSGPTGTVSNSSPAFTFFANEGSSSFECRLDSGGWGGCSSPKNYSSLSDGPHAFEVRATDPAGNTDPSPAMRSFTIDTGPPDTQITSGPSGLTNDSSPSFGFTSDDPSSSFECRLDSGVWGDCSSPKAYSNLAEGAHSFEARATDGQGNTETDPASRTFTVDTAPPSTSITSGPSDTTSDASPSFAFSSSEPGSTFECELDDGGFSPCNSPKAYADLADGAHNFKVRATDGATNTDPSPASRDFTVDTTVYKARISMVKVVGPAKVKKSKKAIYKIKITNSGNATATGVRLKVKGRGVSFSTSVGKIGAKKTRTVKVKLKAKKTGKVKVSFKVTSSNAGGKTVNKKIKVRK